MEHNVEKYKSAHWIGNRHHFRSKLVVANTALRRMITSCPLILALAVASSFAWKLTPLDIDDFPCKPENLKAQNRYICDSEGKVSCLAGWKERPYNPDPHFPCPLPVCDPPCLNGICELPNVCACEIGWEGVDCGTCIKMPGCQRGSCAEEGGKAQPLTCKCEGDWKGALCDIPKCGVDDEENECSNRGTCVDQGGDQHICRCDAGWENSQSGSGICESCVPLAGCVTEHTVEGSGCHSPDDDSKSGFEQIPNSCICTEEWTGVLCDTPQCLSSGGHPIECENGECKEGGQSGDGTQLEAFCQCNVGWGGENCDKCTPAYNCPNTNDPGSGVQPCLQPNECRCLGDPAIASDIDNTENSQRCTAWVKFGTCQDDTDCLNADRCQDKKGTPAVGTCQAFACENTSDCRFYEKCEAKKCIPDPTVTPRP